LDGGDPTSIGVLLNGFLHGALVCRCKGLRLETSAGGAHASTIHSLLEGIALPSKEIISMLTIASPEKVLAF